MTREQINQMSVKRAIETYKGYSHDAIIERNAYIQGFKDGYQQYAAELCHHISGIIHEARKPVLSINDMATIDKEALEHWKDCGDANRIIYVPRWHPTDEQIGAIKTAIMFFGDVDKGTQYVLTELLEKLEGLKL